MLQYQLNTSFTKQFRQDYLVYSFAHAQQIDAIVVESFTGQQNDVPAIINWIKNDMS